MTAPDPITAEERAELRRHLEFSRQNPSGFAHVEPESVLRLLDALEVAEGRARLAETQAGRAHARAALAEVREADLRQRIEALAEDLTSWPDADSDGYPVRAYEVRDEVRDHLRALLLDAPEGGEGDG